MTLIAFDVETTGLDPAEGHRIVEIGMVELCETRLQLTGRVFNEYLNPGRRMSADAQEVHGIDDQFLRDKPTFPEISEKLMDFIGDCRLLAHNAKFDLGFLNAELAAAGLAEFPADRIIDSLDMARRELPKLNRFSLDALCRHFGIDISAREKHGARLDAELLADVYFRLIGGGKDMFTEFDISAPVALPGGAWPTAAQRPAPLPPRITDAEIKAHRDMIPELGDNAVWTRCL